MSISDEKVFREYASLIGSQDHEFKYITEGRLMAWAYNPERKFICVFCGSEPVEYGGIIYCQVCRDYKGIMPDLSEVPSG